MKRLRQRRLLDHHVRMIDNPTKRKMRAGPGPPMLPTPPCQNHTLRTNVRQLAYFTNVNISNRLHGYNS